LDIRSVEFYRAAYKPADFPADKRPQFAMVGRSNVGKSSLINAVLKRKAVARVSQTPGKTQAIHFYLVNDRFHVVDLPGYGYAKISKSISFAWRELINEYLNGADALRLMFLLLDVRRTPGDHDLQMHGWTMNAGIEERVILTKSDKLSNNELAKQTVAIARELEVPGDQMIACSVVTKRGIEQVRKEIASRI
jgi:GTP-binding protein